VYQEISMLEKDHLRMIHCIYQEFIHLLAILSLIYLCHWVSIEFATFEIVCVRKWRRRSRR